MNEYSKIETVYERDINGSKKLIEGSFRSSAVKYLANNTWVFTEQINGTNTRVHWDGHRITFGARTDKSQIPAMLVKRLSEMFLNDETEELFEQEFGGKDVVFFGEGYGPGIQGNLGYRSDVDFILFDVMVDNLYLTRKSVEDIARCFGLDIVPVVLKGTIDEGIAFVKSQPMSTFGIAKMEGVVGRPEVDLCDWYGNRIVVKIKVNDFCKK